jgi:hypothetical protein
MRLKIVVVALLAAACNTPVTDGLQECGPNGECPDGYLCNPTNNRCVMSGGSVALSLTIDGSGSITATGAAAPCQSSSCSFAFTQNATVTLTAQPAAGARFVEWGGACSGTQPTITVTMDAAKSCTAKFADRVTVSASVSGASGAVVAASGDAGATCAGNSCTIDEGGSVTLTAPTIAGSRFTGWSGAGCSGQSPVLVLANVTASVTCTATYEPGIAVIGSVVGATGTVTATSPGGTCSNGGCSVSPGADVTLTAPEIAGHRFTGWSGDPECTGTSRTLVVAGVTRSVSCSANYVERFTVSGTVSGATGTVSVTSTDATADCDPGPSSCEVDARGKATLTAPDLPGFRFTGWSGGCSGSENPLLLTNISADRACVASYAPAVTVSGRVVNGPAASVVASSTSAGADCEGALCVVSPGSTVSLLAPTDDGFRLVSWSGGAGCTGSSNPLVLGNVTATVECVATYVRRFTVTGQVSGVTGVAVAASSPPPSVCAGNVCSVDAGASATLTAPDVPGFRMSGWVGTGCPASLDETLELTNVTANLVCTARYVRRVTVQLAAQGASPSMLIESEAAGAACDGFSCTVDVGSTVAITTTPVDAMRFVGWTGVPCAGHGFGTSFEVVATDGGTCTAHYVDFQTTVAPVLVSPWGSPTGWLLPDGTPVKMFVQPVSGNVVYECRHGRTARGATGQVGDQPWRPCDSASGITTTVHGVPVAGNPSGRYRTEVRLRIVDYTSAIASHAYYAHDSLDRVATCAQRLSDAELYKIVKEFPVPELQSPLNTNFPFHTSTLTERPFVRPVYGLGLNNPDIPGARYNIIAVPLSLDPDERPPDPLFQSVLSLRHSFTLSSDRTMLIVRRQYEARRPFEHGGERSCRNSFQFGWYQVQGVSPCWTESCAGTPRRQMVDCEALVLNYRGQATCVREVRAGSNVFRPVEYSLSGWKKLERDRNISPKRLTPECTGSERECADSIYLPQ